MKKTEIMALTRIKKAQRLLDKAEQEIRDGVADPGGRITGYLLEASQHAGNAVNAYRERYRNRVG